MPTFGMKLSQKVRTAKTSQRSRPMARSTSALTHETSREMADLPRIYAKICASARAWTSSAADAGRAVEPASMKARKSTM